MRCPCCHAEVTHALPWHVCPDCGHRTYEISESGNHVYQTHHRIHKAQEGDIGEDGNLDIKQYTENRQDLYLDRIFVIDNWLPDAGKMWDFGCGAGVMLKVYGEKFETLGTEVDPLCINAMVRGGVKHTMGDPRDCDVVMAWHSLEHTHDIHDTMKRLTGALRTGGLFVCEVPVDRYAYGDEFIGHPHEFTKKSFAKLMIHYPVDCLLQREGIQVPAVLWIGRKREV